MSSMDLMGYVFVVTDQRWSPGPGLEEVFLSSHTDRDPPGPGPRRICGGSAE